MNISNKFVIFTYIILSSYIQRSSSIYPRHNILGLLITLNLIIVHTERKTYRF